ncbi:MAG: preprotein translocase subunit Sec61beta [Thermofilaceae archaeon]|nr:preprotein translocase subunit Sec61beta [Thermofilaceae archaeon]MCX8180693.1 preprotein translocase subunit Sec61beta [Thermofilaceae archaeon]MDW8003797.1 preprotein translocase subunit Sec61beta [Thermofilaceae archaeon]
MSRRGGKKRSVTPTTAAGLVTYFEEELGGLKIRPEVVIVLAVSLMIVVILAHISFPVPP